MSLTPIDLGQLTELAPARRNRYYYGKLMDVRHFTMEQRYVLSKEWLYNRAVLGPGVVCGLGVEPFSTSAGNGLVVHAGLAIDGWGREIIVPHDVSLVPLQLTDQCGQSAPVGTQAGAVPSQVIVQLCYSECQTDFSPTLVSDDCGCGDCEAGTIVETYCLKVTAGTAPAVTNACASDVINGLKAGKLHDVLCTLSQTCTALPPDPCLTLANVTVAPAGTLTVDSCSPRLVAPTNQVLAQLIACLAQCCADTSTPVANLLQVERVDLLQVKGLKDPMPTVVSSLNPPSQTWQCKAPSNESLPNALEVTFTGASLDNSTVTVGKPSGGTFQVKGPGITNATSSAQLWFPALNVVRLFVPRMTYGTYTFTLVGNTGNSLSGGKAIMSQATSSASASDLDGDIPSPPRWPSGDGQPGGDFGPITLKIIS
jgi:hypothetical protein